MANSPEPVESAAEYLGVVCAGCGQSFVIVGTALDPAQVPSDKPIRVGARGPLHGACPHCGHRADYPVDQLRRIRVS